MNSLYKQFLLLFPFMLSLCFCSCTKHNCSQYSQTSYTTHTASTFGIAFRTNGGSDIVTLNVNANAIATKPQDPTQSGYTFAGWYADAALTNIFDFSTPITKSLTLYAKWVAQTNASYRTIFTYTVTNNEVTITGLTPEAQATIINDLTIPSTLTLTNLPVVAIADNAFITKDNNGTPLISADGDPTTPNKNLTGKLIISNNVLSIGKYAFASCSFNALTLPEGLKSIGDHAFSYCSKMASTLTIPSTVTTIGNSAFDDCTFTGRLVIPNGVTSIGNNAFNFCVYFTGTLEIPSSVTSIGSGAFWYCTGLTGTLTIPSSIKTIEDNAFGMMGIGKIILPNTITSIGFSSFENYHAESIILPSVLISIGDYAFFSSSLTSITIPSSVKSIGESAFSSSQSLISVRMESTTPPTIGSGIFSDIIDVSNLVINVPLTSLTDYQNASNWDVYRAYMKGY